MTEECEGPPLPEPTPEHELLQRTVGAWNVKCTYFMVDPPLENEARETVEPVGPFWTVSRFEAEMMGTPFVGRATCGYDPFEQRFVGTWVDSMLPVLYPYDGTYDEGTRTLAMKGRGNMPQFGGVCDYRMVQQFAAEGHHTFDMYVTMPDGNEVQLFHYVYERAD